MMSGSATAPTRSPKLPTMTFYDLAAPAKLNLFLHVTGRRHDGYHLLQSLFRLVSLSDSVTVDLRRDGLISREGSLNQVVAVESDLTVRAAKALQKATGVSLGVNIHVQKRIPFGAGLGGGSSDAATVLLALNRLWRTGLSRQQLMQIGLSLGADVPFFLHGDAGFVQGVGEQIETVCAPDQSYLVFKPSVSIATAEVFSDPDLTRDTENVKITDFSGCINFIGCETAGVSGFGSNDLEVVVLKKFSAVRQVKYWLASQGLQTRLTGSGSCLFAEAGSPERAQLALEKLIVKMQSDKEMPDQMLGASLESVHVCDGLSQHPLKYWVSN